jgi:hypothetical protein
VQVCQVLVEGVIAVGVCHCCGSMPGIEGVGHCCRSMPGIRGRVAVGVCQALGEGVIAVQVTPTAMTNTWHTCTAMTPAPNT